MFRGPYLHNWAYKHPDKFVGKRVVVIGIGNSGADVAVEISRVAEQLEKPTLAFIGFLQPVEATIPTSELQSRWTVRVFKGLCKARVAHRVQYISYMDEIATELGVKPNLLSLFLWDTKLAMEVFFGPCTPYQYCLQGPGKWAGAQQAILTQRDRILKPLRTFPQYSMGYICHCTGSSPLVALGFIEEVLA
ncbi:Dimethylaniline monooxygenase [N-oxide-forming] 3 [Tupaia chinensis]|uniref:Flavin-containing monooxygenase n=1 Tax=Tupaia chinensis TaxID=246437 RepID=L9L7C8_TUPCH|nr:Dimethylaniline monooxygenase [N-oxide-forming] 3 [Tupaia chinensis]